ncbi:MAG: hypothetical protein Q9216_004958 [Gyalolechia sp. 2 TL-2023]
MGTDDLQVQLAAAALAIALTALAIAIVQLLGQLFATADGYRRCQPSVMGAWAKHTRLRWKWSQMRFETLFTIPEIFLWPCNPSVDTASGQRKINGDINWIGELPGVTEQPYLANVGCLESKLVNPSPKNGVHQELACWLPFLSSIRSNESDLHQQKSYEESIQYHSHRRPACRFVRNSWDFMAPELLRPLAVTNIGDIAVIVQRLGMRWLAFRPEDGEMRAEGDGHIIYSTLVRSIGPILHYASENLNYESANRYTRTGGKKLSNGGFNGLLAAEHRFINTAEADMLRFGIMPCHDLMNGKQFALGTIDEVCTTLDSLDLSGSASKKVRDNRQLDPTSTFGFSDLISMAAPMFRLKGSVNIRLPVPTEHCVGLTSHIEGFVVFRQRLGEYVDGTLAVSPQILWVLQTYDAFKAKESRHWEHLDTELFAEDFSLFPFLDEVHKAWDQTTTYFEEIRDSHGFSYHRLVAAHMKYAVHYWHEAHGRIRDGAGREHHGLCDWLAEGMHLYWDYLPQIARDLRAYGKHHLPEVLIIEAWITLMFRAFCWSRCHYFCLATERYPDSKRLPSRYWNSKLPVYLG